MLVMGYGVLPQPDDACPPSFSTHRVVCEAHTNAPISFRDAVRGAAVDGHVVLTLASFDYAENALVWYHAMAAVGFTGCLVVAMDTGTHTYLSNRGVPAVYVPTMAHLNPCCLHRWRMMSWRATNDIKVRRSSWRVSFTFS